MKKEEEIFINALRSTGVHVVELLRASARSLNDSESDLLFDSRLPALVRARVGTTADIAKALSEAVSILIRLSHRTPQI